MHTKAELDLKWKVGYRDFSGFLRKQFFFFFKQKSLVTLNVFTVPFDQSNAFFQNFFFPKRTEKQKGLRAVLSATTKTRPKEIHLKGLKAALRSGGRYFMDRFHTNMQRPKAGRCIVLPKDTKHTSCFFLSGHNSQS